MSTQTISSDLFARDLKTQKKRESWLFSRLVRSSECTCSAKI